MSPTYTPRRHLIHDIYGRRGRGINSSTSEVFSSQAVVRKQLYLYKEQGREGPGAEEVMVVKRVAVGGVVVF